MSNAKTTSMLLVLATMVIFPGCSKRPSPAALQTAEGTANKGTLANAPISDHSSLDGKWKQEFGELPKQKNTTVFVMPNGYVEGLPVELYDKAFTPAEAEWLNRKGFLSNGERNRLSALSEDELRSQAKQGDRSAVLYLAEKLIDSGQGNTMASALRSLANKDNSIPARYLLARYESQGVSTANVTIPDSADGAVHQAWREDETKRQAAASYLMQNYLMGDYRAGQMLYDLYPLPGMNAGSSEGIPPPVFTKALEAIQKARAANPTFAASYDPRPMPQGTFGRRSGQIAQ